jgi:hypothetical protein
LAQAGVGTCGAQDGAREQPRVRVGVFRHCIHASTESHTSASTPTGHRQCGQPAGRRHRCGMGLNSYQPAVRRDRKARHGKAPPPEGCPLTRLGSCSQVWEQEKMNFRCSGPTWPHGDLPNSYPAEDSPGAARMVVSNFPASVSRTRAPEATGGSGSGCASTRRP